MVRSAHGLQFAALKLTTMADRLQGLQPHAGAPHPEARPQHLRWRVW